GAEVDALLVALVALGEGRLALGLVALVEQAAEHLHRGRAVLVLAALRRALHDDPGRDVRDADGRLRLVDVLPALAAGAHGVDLEVLLLDLDLDVVVDIRHDVDGREGGVAPRVGIEGADADEAVDAVPRLQKAVRERAADRDRRILDARLVAGLVVEDLGLETLLLAPAQ